MNLVTKISVLSVAALIGSAPLDADACTRVVYIGDSGIVITGRTLDWKENIGTNLYVMPRGMERAGYDDNNTIKWTSRYGSVVAVGYDMGVSEGMNEKGLVCNLLYLPGTVYSLPGDNRPAMSTSVWAQYVLDNFATTAEAVNELKKDAFRIDAPAMPGGNSTTLHMAISDTTGNSAIIEYIDGKISIHEGKEYQVLTNAPTYDDQLAINDYWQGVGGMHMLPGTNRSSDRFARGYFYINAIPKNANRQMALGGVFGVVRNVSVPLGISVPEQPEISSTRWRSVADQQNKIYFFETTLSPSVIWVDLSKMDLRKGAAVKKLDLLNTPDYPYSGEVNDRMVTSKPFTPMYHIPKDLKL